MQNCKHNNVYEGICNDCGIELYGTSTGTFIDMKSSYSEYHTYTSAAQVQPFEADLKNINIPDEVKNLVVNLASSCPRETHRMGVRRQQLFSYIYLAYLQLGYKFDPDSIRKEMKMSQREINMALRIISGTSSIDIPLPVSEALEPLSAPVVVISPIIYIEEICINNNLSENIEEITKLSKEILEKNKILFEYNPKHIAITLVKHYMNIKGIGMSKFSKINGISDSILKQHLVRINKIV
jgi:hypothetical protein